MRKNYFLEVSLEDREGKILWKNSRKNGTLAWEEVYLQRAEKKRMENKKGIYRYSPLIIRMYIDGVCCYSSID